MRPILKSILPLLGSSSQNALAPDEAPLWISIVKKSPAIFLSIAFVYLLASNFDPFWIVRDAETDFVAVPENPNQLQTCNSILRKSHRPQSNSSSTANQNETDLKSELAPDENCLPAPIELSRTERPFDHPLANAPPENPKAS